MAGAMFQKFSGSTAVGVLQNKILKLGVTSIVWAWEGTNFSVGPLGAPNPTLSVH